MKLEDIDTAQGYAQNLVQLKQKQKNLGLAISTVRASAGGYSFEVYGQTITLSSDAVLELMEADFLRYEQDIQSFLNLIDEL